MTDHKRIAGDALDSLGEWFSQEGMTDATMVSSAIAAQASATLYLAEQQRIANLIAVFSEGGLKSDLPSFTFDAWPNALGQIRTGLGLA